MGVAVQGQFETHPTVKDKLGGLDSCTFSLGGIFNYAKENPDSNNMFVFDVTGPNGAGQIVGRQDPANPKNITDAKLLMNGEEFPLD